MRVLQLIDSLRPGGAEKMAVSYANALAKRTNGSYLCCTRKEGLLKAEISPKVGYLFLNKKSTLDIKAFLHLRRFVVKNEINLLQAHSSSWFLALLVKLSIPGLKLVWHDHYGRELKQRKAGGLKPASRFFDGIISVNGDLKKWAEENLNSRHSRFFRNFLSESNSNPLWAKSNLLEGRGDDFKILCLANLRPQKDHLTLLQAFEKVEKEFPQTTLHLVGKDEQNEYSRGLRSYVNQSSLKEKVFFYGERKDVHELLLQADLGVLSSASEGLPLALLEYGRFGLPVICTAVGQCGKVIKDHGKIVPPGNPRLLSLAILTYIEKENQRTEDAKRFQQEVLKMYSENSILHEVMVFFNVLLED